MPEKRNDSEAARTQRGGNYIKLPLCCQETDYTCGAACIQSLLARYGIHYRQRALAEILHSQPIFGTDCQAILSFMRTLGFKASMHEGMEIGDIKSYIDVGIAPILVIQAWKNDEADYHYSWKNAHYIVACGYYEHGIYAMDPYTLGNYTYLPFPELIYRWHAADKSGVRRLNSGLILEPDGIPVRYDPKAVKHLD